MEKKCCICGKEFIGIGNNASPIKKGICCDSCNSRFIIPTRQFELSGVEHNFEFSKSLKEFEDLKKRLSEKNFEEVASYASIVVFENPATEEKVLICCI